MNANIAEYHVPVNADVRDIRVIFVDEPDEIINPLGIKGVGATRPTRARGRMTWMPRPGLHGRGFWRATVSRFPVGTSR